MISNYITAKTVDYMLEQLKAMPALPGFPAVQVIFKLQQAVYYAKPDKDEVTTVWLNYDYPEDGKKFNTNIN